MISGLCFSLALNVCPPYIPPSLPSLSGNVYSTPWPYMICDFTEACGCEFSLALKEEFQPCLLNDARTVTTIGLLETGYFYLVQ